MIVYTTCSDCKMKKPASPWRYCGGWSCKLYGTGLLTF